MNEWLQSTLPNLPDPTSDRWDQWVIRQRVHRLSFYVDQREILNYLYQEALSEEQLLAARDAVECLEETSEFQIFSYEIPSVEVATEWRKFYAAQLREFIRSMRLILKLVGHIIRLLLKALSAVRFPHQISSSETTWRLLHGSHPPRWSAVFGEPALAKSGRVYLSAGLQAPT